MEYLIIPFLILLNGVFAMSEIALVSTRRTGLAAEAEGGGRLAKSALRLIDQPDRFLSTVQIGITLIGILTGIYSGEVLSADFADVLKKIGIPHPYGVAQTLIVVCVTYFTLVFGELVPKRLGLAFADRLSKIVAPPMNFLSVAAAPFVWVLSKSTQAVFKVFGLKGGRAKITEDEIRSMVRQGAKEGEVQEVERDIVGRVFSLGDRRVESIMTHRSEIVWLDVSASAEKVRALIKETPFKIYPLGRGSLDDCAGVATLKAILVALDSASFSLEKIAHKPHYFHEDMEVYKALDEMRFKKIQYGLVNDEFGTVQGIVTMRDVLSALLGYAPDFSGEPPVVEREGGGWLVDGQFAFYDFLEFFGLEKLFAENSYNTLSGLILDEFGHIPRAGDRLKWKGFSFEIADMDGARIDKVIVEKDEPSAFSNNSE